MAFHGKLLQVTLIGVIMRAMVAAPVAAQAKPDCPNKCGNIEIPFPFGLTSDCYLDQDDQFNITCDQSLKPMWGDFPVISVSIDAHELHVSAYVARDCYNKSGPSEGYDTTLSTGAFTLSKTKNKFIALGCDTYSLLSGVRNGENYTFGCISACDSPSQVVNGSCSGIGCCEVQIPDEMTDIEMSVDSFDNHSKILDFNPCSYAFVVEQGKFNFTRDYLRELPFEFLPVVLDWAVISFCERD